MQNNKTGNVLFKKIIPYILAIFGTYSLVGTLAITDSQSISYSNSLFSVMLFGLLVFVLVRILPAFYEAGKRKHIFAAVFSFFFSIAMQFGADMEAIENVRITTPVLWLRILMMTLFMMPIINSIWDLLAVWFMQSKEKGGAGKSLSFYQIWAIIFLLWLPTLMALYPGAFVYDAQEEYVEVISRAFTMHHPLLHVLLLGGIIHAAEYIGLTANTGIAIYVLLQMAVMSAIVTYFIKMLEKWGMNRKILAGIMVCFGIFPIFPLYAVCTAKDTLFVGFFLLIVLLLADFGNKSFFSMKEMCLFVIASVLMMLLRNNGMYAYLVSIPVIYICVHVVNKKNKSGKEEESGDSSEHKKDMAPALKLVILMLLSMIIFFGCNLILKTVTKATDDEHQEMLTVPIQQIARVYTYSQDVFSEEDIDTLHEVLPEEYLTTYRLRISDVLKSGFDNEKYSQNPAKYRALWLKMGLKKPLIYLNAWFGTSYGYWYPDAINNVYGGNQMYTYQYTESSYFGFETEPPGERDSKFKVLELFYRNMSLRLFQQKLPVISMLFSPGFVFWVFAFVFVLVLREKKNIIPLVPVLLLWLTVLLGPTTIVRYVLILWFIIPLYPVLFYTERN